LPAEQLSNVPIPASGGHDLSWVDGGTQTKLPLTVTDSYVDLGTWSPCLGIGAIALSVRHDDVQVRFLQLQVSYAAGTSAPQTTVKDGPILWEHPASDQLVIKSLWDASTVWTAEPHDPLKGGFIYVGLVRRANPAPPWDPVRVMEEIRRLLTAQQDKAAYSLVLIFLQRDPVNSDALGIRRGLEFKHPEFVR